MLKKIGLKNLRLFSNREFVFKLPLLTVICGTNGSGKSTILKSLLLMRQSQGIRETYGGLQGMLRFVGSQADLGNYSTLVSNNQVSKDIEISISTDAELPRRSIMKLAEVNKLQSKPRDKKCVLESRFKFMSIKRATESDEAGEITSVVPRGVLRNTEYSITNGDRQLASWRVRRLSGQDGGYRYRVDVPKKEILEWDTEFSRLVSTSSNIDTVTTDVDLDGLLPSNAFRGLEGYRLPEHVRRSIAGLTRSLQKIHYLGPLRAASKRYYVAEYDVSPDLDPRGDFLPYVLGGVIEEPMVSHVPPLLKSPVRQPLSQALNGWLYYLRTGSLVNCRSRRQEFEAKTVRGTVVEIRVAGKRGAEKHSIADSGFGYSQVLPILVRGLMAPGGSTLLIEQPEVHLNPALQVRLADFLVSMCLANKQVIVETHSEHVVNAIRVRSATDKAGFLPDNSIIYFIDLDQGKPKVLELNIQHDGMVPTWPYNFFGEAANLTGELLRAQARFRKRSG